MKDKASFIKKFLIQFRLAALIIKDIVLLINVLTIKYNIILYVILSKYTLDYIY